MHPKNKPKIVIIGIGNLLYSDERIGVHVVNELKGKTLPSNVKVFDCGTNGIAVLEAMDGAEKAIIVDAVSSGKEPGTIHIYTVEELAKMDGRLFKLVSLHQFDLIAALELARITNAYKIPTKIVIIGVEAKSLKYSMELSDEVKKAIPKVIKTIIKEIKS